MIQENVVMVWSCLLMVLSVAVVSAQDVSFSNLVLKLNGKFACINDFDYNVARVVCREAGLGDMIQFYSSLCPGEQHGDLDFFKKRIHCETGLEESLDECELAGVSYCSWEYQCVSVECTSVPPRTQLSSNDGSGYLSFDGQYVCNYQPSGINFGDEEAKVACNQIGYKYVEDYEQTECPNSSPSFSIRNVDCVGMESSLENCFYDYDTSNCTRLDCIYLECTDSRPLSSAEIAGIIIGSVSGFIILLFIIKCCHRRRQIKKEMEDIKKKNKQIKQVPEVNPQVQSLEQKLQLALQQQQQQQQQIFYLQMQQQIQQQVYLQNGIRPLQIGPYYNPQQIVQPVNSSGFQNQLNLVNGQVIPNLPLQPSNYPSLLSSNSLQQNYPLQQLVFGQAIQGIPVHQSELNQQVNQQANQQLNQQLIQQLNQQANQQLNQQINQPHNQQPNNLNNQIILNNPNNESIQNNPNIQNHPNNPIN